MRNASFLEAIDLIRHLVRRSNQGDGGRTESLHGAGPKVYLLFDKLVVRVQQHLGRLMTQTSGTQKQATGA